MNQIDYIKTKVKYSQTSGVCECLHRTILDEFYRVIFRRKLYENIAQFQEDFHNRLNYYNEDRTHQGKKYNGKIPLQTLIEDKEVPKDKFINQI